MGASYSDRQNRQNVLRTLITLSIPTIIEEVLSTLLQYVDTAMVGHLGEDATSAVSVTTTISWLAHSIPGAIGVAALALISKAYGSGDTKQIKKVANETVYMTFICGVILTVLTIGLSPFIPIWMGAEKSIQKEASIYFAIICIPMLFRTGSRVFASAIRATADTKTPMVINMGANVLNIALNYVFIFVLDMGVRGAAIGSAISYTLAGMAMFVAFNKNEYLHLDRIHLKSDKSIRKQFFDIGLPVFATNTVSCLGYVVFASLVTGMGNTVFAAHSIAVTAETLFYIPGYGLRTATSALIGISVGEGDKKKFEKTSTIAVWTTVLMMCVSGAILFVVARPLMNLFTSSSEVARIGANMLRLVAFSEPFFGLMIVTEGIFYGLGRTKYAFVIESFGMWGVRILSSYICVKHFGFGLRVVWYCMIVDNITKAILLAIPLMIKSTRNSIYEKTAVIENVTE